MKGKIDALRDRAETRLRKKRPAKPADEPQRVLHELQVHQVELEMQNAELLETRDRLEVLLEQYTDLYDFAPVGYFTLNTEGVINRVNLTGARLVGIERARLTGSAFAPLLATGMRPKFKAFLQQVFASQPKQSGELTLLHRIVSIEAQRSPDGRECRAMIKDITNRKQAEDAVRVSEIRYRRLFEAAHDGVLILDPVTRKITDANPFMTRLLDYPHDQLVGKELFEIGLLEDEAASQEMFRKLKRQHEVRYEDLPLESKTGRHQEVEVVANLYQENGHAVIQCNIRDITERKKAEWVRRRLDVLTASNRKLEEEIVRRQAVEKALRQSEKQQGELLTQSRAMQEQLRQLSRQVLQAQEGERKRISRELHDVIAQTLTGINIRLGTLKQSAGLNVKDFGRKITRTQRLVEKSVHLVHRFARELRPAVLDDLGLIPAMHAYLKGFMADTGIRVSLQAFAGIERADSTLRTVLYRVAQEALTNVERHAHASRVTVSIAQLPQGLCMKITDDGRSFDVERALQGGKRLGLLGMRERLEMVGGSFSITSSRGKGTTIEARLPLPKVRIKKTPSTLQ